MKHAPRKHTAVMRGTLPLKEQRVLDVGCGSGGLVRFMTREGARVTGLDTSEKQLARARDADGAGDEDYISGVAEDLPFEAGIFDAVVFFNSLHHVPVEHQATALREALRVLRSGGEIYVLEPLAEGAFFEMMRPIEDETDVRASAYEALLNAANTSGVCEHRELSYEAPLSYESFEACRNEMIAVDESRRPAIEAQGDNLRIAFESAAEFEEGAYRFASPSRLNLLRKA
ncbi:class I SAM-dependent methyltransferase [Denitrobaculum tricleocarpae]|uniref:Class I SAM-dependent methyltransferase n=1 Tax=Denitrobaculum tricleocarpae TaxID=2591009 RepID=A0A545TWQ3_9PROT|nr:class I SAM-dependent methyltransferase [Denitrobaculum tricleocarpae]TQV81647.1 class I SAM-dependent methyltransferase [Denitrobaculum tricleocarpae]